MACRTLAADWTAKADVLAAVARDGRTLQHASADLKNDREVVLVAVAQNGWALQSASSELRNDRDVVLAAVSQNGWALESAPEALKDDKEVVLAAVGQFGLALDYASARLQNDVAVVLAAAVQDGSALKYASAELKAIPGKLQRLALQSDRLRAENRTKAAASEHRGKLAAALQRLAFAAGFMAQFSQPGAHFVGGELGLLPAQILYDVDAWHARHIYARGGNGAARGTALLQMPAAAVMQRARAQGWYWRDAQDAATAVAELGQKAAATLTIDVADGDAPSLSVE
eukprot:SAG11_NODE_1986_length_3962_cov_4.050220_5_plen_286_part_00